MKIRCPRCAWRHDGGEYWQCEKCLAVFDTFRTHARCPECPNAWDFTACPTCHRTSLHRHWYVEGGGEGERESADEELLLPAGRN